jgi:hypothetical protein
VAVAVPGERDHSWRQVWCERDRGYTHDVREQLPLPDASTDAVYSHLLMSMAC